MSGYVGLKAFMEYNPELVSAQAEANLNIERNRRVYDYK